MIYSYSTNNVLSDVMYLYTHPDVSPGIKQELSCLQQYDFLWQQDLHSSYSQFLEGSPTDKDCCMHVESLLQLEGDIATIPDAFAVGPLLLSTRPVKNSFRAWAVAWKTEFVSFLHNKTKVSPPIIDLFHFHVPPSMICYVIFGPHTDQPFIPGAHL